MAKQKKVLMQILSGQADAAIDFVALCSLVKSLGFSERVKGGHHIFSHPDVEEILNLQPRKGQAKPYQVKQVRQVILKYKLAGGTDGK